MLSRLLRLLLPLAAVAVLLPVAGCQDSTPTRPIVVQTPVPVRGVIVQTGFENFQTDTWVSIPVVVSQKGVLDITVDWTSSETWMYVYFGNTDCGYNQLAGKTCPFLISSETKEPKPRYFVTDTLQPGTYYLVLYNVPRNPVTGIGSDATEAVWIQVGETVNPTAQQAQAPIRLGRRVTLTPPQP
jgi:hypothetical protein